MCKSEECYIYKIKPYIGLKCRQDCILYNCKFRGHIPPYGEIRESCIAASNNIYIKYFTNIFIRQTSLDTRHSQLICCDMCSVHGYMTHHLRDETLWGDPKIDALSMSFIRNQKKKKRKIGSGSQPTKFPPSLFYIPVPSSRSVPAHQFFLPTLVKTF